MRAIEPIHSETPILDVMMGLPPSKCPPRLLFSGAPLLRPAHLAVCACCHELAFIGMVHHRLERSVGKQAQPAFRWVQTLLTDSRVEIQ